MFRSVVLIVLAFSLVTSACFQIRQFNLSPRTLQPGQQGSLTLNMHRVSGGENSENGHIFILVGYNDTQMQLDQVRPFDLLGNFGGPLTRTRDNALRDHLLAGDNCAANGIDAANLTGFNRWRAFRTVDTVNSNVGGMNDPFRVKLKFTRLFADNNARSNFVIFTGTWTDWVDPNGAPDPGEAICVGMVISSFAGRP